MLVRSGWLSPVSVADFQVLKFNLDRPSRDRYIVAEDLGSNPLDWLRHSCRRFGTDKSFESQVEVIVKSRTAREERIRITTSLLSYREVSVIHWHRRSLTVDSKKC